MEKEKCCGNCKYHVYDDMSDDWVCVNDESCYLGDWTGYEDSCEDWEKV